MMQYTKVTTDGTYFETIGGALGNASLGKSASFLGDPSLAAFSAAIGKWNDDIAWWALATALGAEIGGVGATTPLGSTFLNITEITFEQMFETDQLDNECGGGIYWARNRKDSSANRALYKSTITNVEAIILGVKLYQLTGEKSYLDRSIQIYDWLLGPSGIVTQGGVVYDGVYATNCAQIVKTEHSYNAGLFLGGAALLYSTTKNQKYITDSKIVLRNFEAVFTRNNIVIDPCELSGNCKQNQAQFKGVAIFSLCYVYELSNDDALKNQVKTWIEASSDAMLKTCDSNWSCSNFWLPNATNVPKDVHNQINAVFVGNARSLVAQVKVEGLPLPAPKGSQGTSDGNSNGGSQSVNRPVEIFFGLILLAFLI